MITPNSLRFNTAAANTVNQLRQPTASHFRHLPHFLDRPKFVRALPAGRQVNVYDLALDFRQHPVDITRHPGDPFGVARNYDRLGEPLPPAGDAGLVEVTGIDQAVEFQHLGN